VVTRAVIELLRGAPHNPRQGRPRLLYAEVVDKPNKHGNDLRLSEVEERRKTKMSTIAMMAMMATKMIQQPAFEKP
jgi:hypothetical protein